MARIRGKDTKPELIVRKRLHALGFRFRLHRRDLPGNPDIVLPRYKAVVFVHGCFWHAHQDCKHFRIPKNDSEFWETKLLRNRIRDQANLEKLMSVGWRVAILWECALRWDIDSSMSTLADWLITDGTHTEITPEHPSA